MQIFKFKILSGGFSLGWPVAGMGSVTDTDQFGIFGTLDPNLLHTPKRSYNDTLLIYFPWHEFPINFDAKSDFGKKIDIEKLVSLKYIWLMHLQKLFV